ncbi:MAG: DUF433 domain-containing protein [Stigonema ocellatum SAG 48.90 = DSM 106950]|nr:DUF433 domain-containing protein [Stigonema ocellatum SAG 48.90 = DSM 106950]
MQLEDYFDFQRDDDIRLKGTRIGIETVLYEYIYQERTAEEIASTWTTLTLEEVYATILYYLQNKEAVSQYIANWLEHGHRARVEQRLNPSQKLLKTAVRLKKIREAQELLKQADGSYILNR